MNPKSVNMASKTDEQSRFLFILSSNKKGNYRMNWERMRFSILGGKGEGESETRELCRIYQPVI